MESHNNTSNLVCYMLRIGSLSRSTIRLFDREVFFLFFGTISQTVTSTVFSEWNQLKFESCNSDLYLNPSVRVSVDVTRYCDMTDILCDLCTKYHGIIVSIHK